MFTGVCFLDSQIYIYRYIKVLIIAKYKKTSGFFSSMKRRITTITDPLSYKREEVYKSGKEQAVLMRVGAVENKLRGLRKVLEDIFDDEPVCTEYLTSKSGDDKGNKMYIIKGTKKTIEYLVFLEYRKSPAPQYFPIDTHSVAVLLPKGAKDEISDVIEKELKKYEQQCREKRKKTKTYPIKIR